MTKKTLTHQEYENRLLNIEADAYPIESYINSSTPIMHECIKGHTWLARPNAILRGKGCPTCKGGVKKDHSTYQLQVADRGIEVLDTYVNAYTHLLHKCVEGHEWSSTPTNILSGSRCPICSLYNSPVSYRFDVTKSAILYYIKIDNEYYKVGITNKSIEQRFRQDRDRDIKILFGQFFIKGQDALDKEAEILEKFKHKRIYVPDFLKSKGNTELFKEDILELDRN